MDYSQMIGDVLQTVGKLDIFLVHIVGHSLGGKLAMAWAQTFQDKLKGLVVLDITPVDYGQKVLEMQLKRS
ncbi:alpha/beta fold hydrolase [Candidatus Methylacidiphilum infernorum]|uniref:Alpha/beta fold hydrolase n=1 Tax=Candidatus Methylacidiphilum infernorum TaxID=511746 RepID=A0ABX7PWZ3_9BACT|nr:alpha/beta fold hydrolase [Candidatus Methylacidiphilum infernorum]QSR87086.1 alpha/beta fold hydrolase [Candidatus Methylacidiphilum infernorum]